MLPSSLSCFTPSRRPGQAASSLASPGFTWLSLQRHSPCELASVTWQCGLQVVLTALGQVLFASPGFTCSESARAAASPLQSESRHAALFARLGSGFCLTLSGSSRVFFGFKLTGSWYWQVRVALTLDDERSLIQSRYGRSESISKGAGSIDASGRHAWRQRPFAWAVGTESVVVQRMCGQVSQRAPAGTPAGGGHRLA